MENLKYDIFRAYYDARKNKRNTVNQLCFEIEYEQNLMELYDEIVNRSYEPRPSICFIINDPVKREILAADFRDRVVHHLIFNYINPFLETQFIEDSYSCRKGKGTHYGIRRVAMFLEKGSTGSDCYVMKLDIQGYFMGINKHLLWEKLQQMLAKGEEDSEFNKINSDFILFLLEKTIWNDPRKSCIFKSRAEEWTGLPNSKSLFYTESDCGLPIGNLTSQLFSNVYLHDFDLFVKNELGVEFYGRYVDDFVLIHPCKAFLLDAKEKIRRYLQENSGLTLHPKKFYLQHYTKGVAFLGAYIKPHRIYVANRTKNNFCRAVKIGAKNLSPLQMRATLNSYLGIMQHYKTYNIRRKVLLDKSYEFFRYGYLTGNLNKFVLKK
jgi:retron-type reverse transcriptase